MNAVIMRHCGDGCHPGCLITGRVLMEWQKPSQAAADERKICVNNQRCAASACVFPLDQSGVKN